MKSFINFLIEATQSKAVQQANSMGLTSDGHGGWYDKKGEFVAKTKQGKLEFYNAGEREGQDPPQGEENKRLSKVSPPPSKVNKDEESAPKKAAASSPKSSKGAEKESSSKKKEAKAKEESGETEVQTAPADVPKTKGTLTIAFGRFNPPTVGHEKLLNKVADSSDEKDYIIVPSRTEDKKKNPLSADRKAALMRQMYPDHAEKIVNDTGNKTIFDVLRKAHNDGYANVRVVGGGDRVKEYEKLVNKYNGSTYQFDNIEVVNAGDRDPDAEGVEGMSASKMRKAVKDNDFRAFKKGLPKHVDSGSAVAIFKEIQSAMGVPETEMADNENWQIAPRLDEKNLRENYVKEKIFNIGDMVVHDSTGLVGEIVRKGANHLICVSEDKKMFKTWAKDVSPFIEPYAWDGEDERAPESGGSADSTPTEREVGTDTLRAFLQKLTPGQRVQSYSRINKLKK